MLAFKDILTPGADGPNKTLEKKLWELSFITSDTLKAGYVADSKIFDDHIAKIAEAYESVKEEWRQVIVRESEKLVDSCELDLDQFCICGHHYIDHEENNRCDYYLGTISSGDMYCACSQYIQREELKFRL